MTRATATHETNQEDAALSQRAPIARYLRGFRRREFFVVVPLLLAFVVFFSFAATGGHGGTQCAPAPSGATQGDLEVGAGDPRAQESSECPDGQLPAAGTEEEFGTMVLLSLVVFVGGGSLRSVAIGIRGGWDSAVEHLSRYFVVSGAILFGINAGGLLG